VVDQIVQLEDVDLAGVEAGETIADPLEKQAQQLLVICRDRSARRTPTPRSPDSFCSPRR
jgi:hypothetical protein